MGTAVLRGNGGDDAIPAPRGPAELRRLHGWRSGGVPRGPLRRRAHPFGRLRLRTSECEGPRPLHVTAEARLGVHTPQDTPSVRARTMSESTWTSTSAQ